jgi:hypothetical protein
VVVMVGCVAVGLLQLWLWLQCDGCHCCFWCVWVMQPIT